MQDLQLSGFFVAPLAVQIAEWVDAGKLGDDDLDHVLTSNARALVDSSSESIEWMPLEDVESLVAVVAEQLGGGSGLVEWADVVVADWSTDADIVSLLGSARYLIDGVGYCVTQLSERLILDSGWQFEGGRDRFSVRLPGLEFASSELMSLLGALLSRLAQGIDGHFTDLRFDGVDTEELRIFGARSSTTASEDSDEIRLHRAALVG